MLASVALALSLALPAQAASPVKQDICHFDETTQTFSVINVSTNAVAKHFSQHGDSFPAVYFADADGDGFGDANGATDRCPNDGFVDDNTDCDDGDASVNPGAEEVPYDGIDNDCTDDTRDDDLDEDGFGIAEDCDDGDSSVNPGAEEVCDNGIDDNCDGVVDEGCDTDCPCYTIADIDAAYASFLTHQQIYTYTFEYAQCQEWVYDYTYGNDEWHEDGTQIWFQIGSQNDYYSYYAYEYEYSGFYGVSYSYDYDYWGSYSATYCNGYTGEYVYDGVNYTGTWTDNFQYVTDEQAESCEQLLRDWAADNAMDCPLYTYTY